MKTSNEQLRIEAIRVKDLYDFACEMQNGDVVPITKHRALAHTKNPHADENDTGMLAAFLGKKCVGYLGVLPGLLRTGDRFSKVYWLSAFYVPPKYRNTLAALHLVNKAFELKHDLFFTGISKEAQEFNRIFGPSKLEPLDYHEINFGSLNLLSPFLPLQKILNKLGIKSKILDAANRAFYRLIKKLFYALILFRHRNNFIYKEVDEIDEDQDNREQQAEENEFYRDGKIINWMLRYKWVLEGKNADSNYYFSNTRDIFRYICLKIYSPDGKDYNGFLVLSISSQNSQTFLKVLDFTAPVQAVLNLALKYAGTYMADIIEMPKITALDIKRSFPLRILVKKSSRAYLCYPKEKTKSFLNDIKLNYCDGDIAFT